ncbi:MAG: Cna domain protein [Phycisphaerales bacterium]|nr:Cna domain protein [Phycisphaerales bacterium]
MRRSVLASSVRTVVEALEPRRLLSTAPAAVLTPGTGSITGVVFNDLNGNGIADAGENPIANALVYLDLNKTGTLDAGDPTAISDASGVYTLPNLGAGSYRVEAQPGPGLAIGAPGFFDVTVAAATPTVTNVPVGIPSAIVGTVFDDQNQDGIRQNGPMGIEPFLAFDTVYTDLNHNGVFDAGDRYFTVANNAGMYNLGTLGPGTYQIRVVPRAGFHQNPPGFLSVTVANGQVVNLDVPENNFSVISGKVFNDLNGNSVLDGTESGVPNELVFLDILHDNTRDPGDPFTFTDSNGNYSFSMLTPGVYRVEVQSTVGFLQDKPGFIDVTINQQGDAPVVNVPEGVPSSISGIVFNDANHNGVRDAGELGVPNQTVFLDQNSNGVFDPAVVDPLTGLVTTPAEPTSTTDASGAYSFSNIPPGSYIVRFILPAGAQQILPHSGSFSFNLGSGQNVTNQDFSIVAPDLTIRLLSTDTRPVKTGVIRKMQAVVTNIGALPFTGQIGVTIYASTTNTLDPTTASIIGGFPGRQPISLKPGQSHKFKMQYDFPLMQPSGSYFLFAHVVTAGGDANPFNDTSPAIGPVTVALAFIDLGIAYQNQPPVDPFYIGPNQPVELNVVVNNTGDVPSNGNLSFKVYASDTPTLEPGALVVFRPAAKRVSLKPHAPKTFHLIVPNPGPMLGAKFLIVVVDSGDPLGETNLANNIVVPANPTIFR